VIDKLEIASSPDTACAGFLATTCMDAVSSQIRALTFTVRGSFTPIKITLDWQRKPALYQSSFSLE